MTALLFATLSPIVIIVAVIILLALIYVISRLDAPLRNGGYVILALILIFGLLYVFGVL
jgi:hypothetical protein